MKKVQEDSSIPRYIQIQQQIRRFIQSGKIRLGGRLPSENELASQFGVSRMTLRQALGKLEEDEVIDRKHGIGTFVTQRADVITAELAFPPSLTTLLTQAGYMPTSQVLRREVTDDIPKQGKKLLMLNANETAAYTSRLRLGDDIPLAINQSWLPSKLVPGITEVDFVDGSIIRTLIEVYQIMPTKGVEWVEPTLADRQEAELLQVPQGSPLLLMTTISYKEDNTPVEFSKTFWRGDRLRLQINSRDFQMTFRDESK